MALVRYTGPPNQVQRFDNRGLSPFNNIGPGLSAFRATLGIYKMHKAAYDWSKGQPWIQHFKDLHNEKYKGRTNVRGRTHADTEPPPTPAKTPAKVTGKRKNPSVTDSTPKKASKVNPGTKQMAKTYKRKNPGSNRRGRPAKRSGKKYGRATKSRRKGGKTLKGMKNLITAPGPVGRLSAYLPTTGIPAAGISLTAQDFKCYDLVANDTKSSGFVSTIKNQCNWLGYQILTQAQHVNISTTGERTGGEQAFEPTNSKGLFDPAPMGVKTTSEIGYAANYIKETETFVYKKFNLHLYLSNCERTPVRVWVDLWKCKDDLSVGEGTEGNRPGFSGPIEEIGQCYRRQPYFSGGGAHTGTATANLFKNTEFMPLKVPGRHYWSHQNRKILYMNPGDEVRLDHKLTDIVWDGKKIKERQDAQGDTFHFVKGVSHYITVCVLGLLGKDPTAPNPSAHVKAELSTNLKMDIVACRANVFQRQPNQYLFLGDMGKIAPTGEPQVVEVTRTVYPV